MLKRTLTAAGAVEGGIAFAVLVVLCAIVLARATGVYRRALA